MEEKNKEATIIKEIDKLAPPGVDSRMLDITKSQNNRNPELNDIQLRQTRKSTRNDKKNTAPLDGIEYRMLKKLPKKIKEI